jgi:hypothetical protein
MATRFAQIFTRTGARNLLAQFGEAEGIVYYPRGSGTPRAISAIVQRNNPDILSEVGDVISQYLFVRVLNDETSGISATEIDSGLDMVDVALRTDGQRERRPIMKVTDTSSGMVRFIVR